MRSTINLAVVLKFLCPTKNKQEEFLLNILTKIS